MPLCLPHYALIHFGLDCVLPIFIFPATAMPSRLYILAGAQRGLTLFRVDTLTDGAGAPSSYYKIILFYRHLLSAPLLFTINNDRPTLPYAFLPRICLIYYFGQSRPFFTLRSKYGVCLSSYCIRAAGRKKDDRYYEVLLPRHRHIHAINKITLQKSLFQHMQLVIAR